MQPAFADKVCDKLFARRLSVMIESRLIWYKHYYLWTDDVIDALDNPPSWIIDLATTKYFRDAVYAINRFVYGDSPEFNLGERTDEFVACLFLRCDRGEISWATFLAEAGAVSDAANASRGCEYFYTMLNTLENHLFDPATEHVQKLEIEGEFSNALMTVKSIYDEFIRYFRRYVSSHS